MNQAKPDLKTQNKKEFTFIDKKLYIFTVKQTLSNIFKPSIDMCLYKGNRPIDYDKVECMYQEQLKHFDAYGHCAYSGTSIHVVTINEKTLLIDGQHRMCVFERLYKFNPHILNNFEICVFRHRCKSLDQVRKLFLDINKNSNPVAEIYKNEDLNKIINIVIDHIKLEYDKKNFKPSRQCHRPFICLEILAEQLSMSSKIKECIDVNYSHKELGSLIFKKIYDYNNIVKYYDRTDFYKNNKSTEIATINNSHTKLMKLKKNPFFL